MIPMNNIWQQSNKKESASLTYSIFTCRKYGASKGQSLYNLVIIHQQPPQKVNFSLEKFTNFMCLLYFAYSVSQPSPAFLSLSSDKRYVYKVELLLLSICWGWNVSCTGQGCGFSHIGVGGSLTKHN